MGEWPMRIVFFATGNNPTIGGDTFRRIVRIRMEADCENPSERTAFKYPRLKQHVRTNRVQYVIDALTILRAYIVAGRPKAKLPAFGSYEEWSDLVRQCVVWVGMDDPIVSASTLAGDGDTKRAAFKAMVELWETIDPKREGMTASQIVEQVADGPKHQALREALAEMGCVKEGKLNARQTGYRFREFKGRVVGEYRFQGEKGNGGVKWVARQITPKGDDGDDDDDHSPLYVGKGVDIRGNIEGENPTPGGNIVTITPIVTPIVTPTNPPQCQACGFDPSPDCDREGCPTPPERKP